MNVPIVLASSSPRRKQLLELLGLTFEVVPADIDETWRNGEAPAVHAERLAREKAATVARPEALVVGADTIVVIGGEILGKPRDAGEARAMLRRLAGRDHEVFTAVAVAWQGKLASGTNRTAVHVRPLDDDTIAAYVATGEPLDKAGAYGIQGIGGGFISHVEGSRDNVMGLPLDEVVVALKRRGIA